MAPPASPLARELRAFGVLAPPIIASFVGNQLMSLVDTAFVGRLGAAQLAAVGLGNSLYFAIAVVGLGLVIALDPLVAQAVGAGELGRARGLLGRGLRIAVLASVPLGLLLVGTSTLLGSLGVDPEVARLTTRFAAARAPGMVFFLAFAATRAYLQALGRPGPIVWASVAANVVNLVGNAALIGGDDSLASWGLPRVGAPAWGIVGSGVASTTASAVMLLSIARPVWREARRAEPVALESDIDRKLVRLGSPISLQLLAEVGAFTIVAVLAARLGDVPAGAHQVALTLASATFQIALGLASATAVRVGHAVGARDTAGARRAGLMGFGLGLAVMCVGLVAFGGFAEPLARALTTDEAVVAAAIPLVHIAAIFQLSDGAQAIGSGALRGAGDTTAAPRWNVIGHYALGLPIAVGLGLGLGWGAPGLWWGLSAGLTFVGVALFARFWALSSREIARA